MPYFIQCLHAISSNKTSYIPEYFPCLILFNPLIYSDDYEINALLYCIFSISAFPNTSVYLILLNPFQCSNFSQIEYNKIGGFCYFCIKFQSSISLTISLCEQEGFVCFSNGDEKSSFPLEITDSINSTVINSTVVKVMVHGLITY